MNHFVQFIFTLLFFLVSESYACLCTKGQGKGPYCGGELSFTGGGSDCGTEILWNCKGKGQVAERISPCAFGCCGITGKNSFCCSADGCPGCPEPYLVPKLPQNPIPTTSNITTPSIPTPSIPAPSIPTSTILVTSSPITTPTPPSETPKIIIGTVSGIVGTALIIGIGIFGYKWNKRKRQKQDDIMRIPGNIQSQDGILRIPGNDTDRNKTRIA